jgi:hypothetical protein
VVNFPALIHLRKFQRALETGYAPGLLELAPDSLEILKNALKYHERNMQEVDLLSKPLVSLADKVYQIKKDDKTSEWWLKPGVRPFEYLYNLEAIIYANNQVRRD